MTATAKKPMSIAAGIREGMRAWPSAPKPEAPPPPPVRKPVATGRKVKPHRPVDELARWFPDRPENTIIARTTARDREVPFDVASVEPYMDQGTVPRSFAHDINVVYKPLVRAPRGPEAIVGYLARRGVTLKPTADGAFAVEAEAGRLDEATRNAITAAGPLLRAYLHGSPRKCAMPAHVGSEPPDAVTLTLGGAGWCGECSG